MKISPSRSVLIVLLLFVLLFVQTGDLSAQSGNPPAFTPASIRFEDDVTSVLVEGNTAYVGTLTRFYILDMTHPITPRTIGSIDAPILEATIKNGHIYATSGSYLRIIDVREPMSPIILSKNRLPENTGHNTISLHDQYVFIGHDTGLAAIDVSDPYSPTLVGNLEYVVGGVNGIEIREVVTDMGQRRYAYLATQQNRVWEGMYGGGLRIVDVTDPTDMQQIYPCGNVRCTDWDMFDLAVEGNYIFTVRYADPEIDGLYIYDVSDPNELREVAFQRITAPAWHVAVQNNRAHVATGSALENFGSIQTFDVTDKANPRQVGLHGIEVNPINARLAASPACLFVPQGARGLKILCESTITPTPPSLVYMPMVQAAG